MSEHNTSINRSYIDNFSVKEFTRDKLVPKFFPDKDISDRTVGMIGLTTEQVSNISEDLFNTASVLFREAFPNRAEIDESIYSHAALFQLSNIFSTAAVCTFILCIDEQAILDNRTKGEALSYFYIDKNLEFNVDGIPFVLDYDIKIRVISKKNENTGETEYLYAASYVLDNEKNGISNITDPYIKVRRTARTDNETLSCIALEVTAHQCYREVVYEPIINNSKINYPVIDINYNDKIAGFDIYYRAPDSEEFVQMTPLLVYSQPLFNPFCYYELASTGVLRISFNSKDSYWMPEFNSELKVVLYKTLGSDGNFSIYNGTNYVINQDSERFKYSDKYVLSVKAVTASVGGSDQSNLEKLQALTLEAYRTANALTTENDLAEFFNNYKYRFDNSDILFLKRRDDLFERLYSSFIIMSKDEYKYKTSTLNMDTNMNMMKQIEPGLYVIEPGTLFTSPQTSKAEFLLDSEKNSLIKIHYLTDCHYYSKQKATLDDLYKVVRDDYVGTDGRKTIKISNVLELMKTYVFCDPNKGFDGWVDGETYYIYDAYNDEYHPASVYKENTDYYILSYPNIAVGDYVIRHGYRDAKYTDDDAQLIIPDMFTIPPYQNEPTNEWPQLSLDVIENDNGLKSQFSTGNLDEWKNTIVEENTAITNKLQLSVRTDVDFYKNILIPILTRNDAVEIDYGTYTDIDDISYLYANTIKEAQSLIYNLGGGPNAKTPEVGECYVKRFTAFNPSDGLSDDELLYSEVDPSEVSVISNTEKRYYIKSENSEYKLVDSGVAQEGIIYYERTPIFKVGDVENSSDAVTTISREMLGLSDDEYIDLRYVEIDDFYGINDFINGTQDSVSTLIEGIDSSSVKFLILHDKCGIAKVETQLMSNSITYKVDTISNAEQTANIYGIYNNSLDGTSNISIGDIVIQHTPISRGYFSNNHPIDNPSASSRKKNHFLLIEKEEYRKADKQIQYSVVERAKSDFNTDDGSISCEPIVGNYVVPGGKPVQCSRFMDIINLMDQGYSAIPTDDNGNDADVYIEVDSTTPFNIDDIYYTATVNWYGKLEYTVCEGLTNFEPSTVYYTHHAFRKSNRNKNVYSVFDYIYTSQTLETSISDSMYLYDITEEEFAELMHKYNDIYKFKNLSFEVGHQYFCNGTDYTRYYIIQQDDQSEVEEYIRNRLCSIAEYANRYGYETPVSSIFDYSSNELLFLDEPFENKYLYVNPFLIRFSKNPNLLSTYLTYIHNRSVLDFVNQNDNSFVQFLSHQVQVDRGFNKDKNYHIKTYISSNISLRSSHLPINIEENEKYDSVENRYRVVHYDYYESTPSMDIGQSFGNDGIYYIKTSTGYRELTSADTFVDGVQYYKRTTTGIINRFYNRDEDLRVFFAIFNDNNMLCYTELIPTAYDGSSYTFEGDVYTDDHISVGTSTSMRILEKLRYYKNINYDNKPMIDLYEVNPTDIRTLEHFRLDIDTNTMEYIGTCNRTNVDLSGYTEDRNTVNTSSFDTINIPLENVTCKIFTLYNRVYDEKEQDLVIITNKMPNSFAKYESDDSNIHNYIETNEYATITSPITFMKYLDSVRTNLIFKDFISKDNNGEFINEPLDIELKSLPLLRWSTCLNEELLDHFMTSFLMQYNTLVSIKDERLRNATNIDIKLYNTYGFANNYFIGEDKERLNTVNLKLEFDMWFDHGTDLTIALTEVKKFIKSEVETINANKTNNLHISNLMRKIEHTFDYVDHIRFVRINNYDTSYQTIKNIVVNIDELDKYARREYVPELLVIDIDNILINEYLIDE